MRESGVSTDLFPGTVALPDTPNRGLSTNTNKPPSPSRVGVGQFYAGVDTRERMRAAASQRPVLQMSFLKYLHLMRPLRLMLRLAADVLDTAAKRALGRAVAAEIRRAVKPKHRARSCARAVRQPIKGWPRLLQPKYVRGTWRYRILNGPK